MANVSVQGRVYKHDDLMSKASQLFDEGDNPETKITEYEVIVYGTEVKVKDRVQLKDVVHALIRLYDEEGYQYVWEWGHRSDPSHAEEEESPVKNVSWYRYKERSWFGRITHRGDIVIPVTLGEVISHASKWQIKFGKGGQYPNNCRGYVDSFLVDVANVPRLDWKEATA